jgi:hypothetical protein
MSAADLTSRLKQAEGTAATLAACGDAFEFIQRSAVAYAEPGSNLYYPFLSTVPVACEGRDHIWRAPSIQHSPSAPVIEPLNPEMISPDQAADALVGLSFELSRTMAEAAQLKCETGDRDAFLDASALAATEVIGLLKRP